jgi:predicted enzyme related to lactoylglutathione lyase
MKNPIGNVVWFEIPADNVKRAQKFYRAMFGWKIKKMPGMEYWHIETGGEDASPDGGMMKRCDPRQKITNYVFVESVDKAAAKVKKLGGKVIVEKTAVPGMGFFVICMDTEKNAFAVWERAAHSK